ncbi:MAG: ferritin-like domain-containing protein [Terriglobales bacterium]
MKPFASGIWPGLGATMNRRRALSTALGLGTAGVAGMALAGCGGTALLPAIVNAEIIPKKDEASKDTPQQIFTAALIAEDLATAFYYNGLIGGVIQDPNLAGVGGTATNVSATGNVPNVGYLRGALSEEITHANLLRSLIGGTAAANDPVQTFYFPVGSFDMLGPFLTLLDALESAFIGAYLTATQEFAQMAADTKSGAATQVDQNGKAYTSVQLEYFAKVAASILGIESEHRALGRAINPSPKAIPANNLNYEQTDGLTAVYNGSGSAAAALGPFLASGSNLSAYSLSTALANAASVSLATTGNPPQA